MHKDRNYYRQCDDGALIIMAREEGDDLSIVLAERLGDANFAKDHADRHEIADLEGEIDMLKEELAEARSTIRYLETELENAQ